MPKMNYTKVEEALAQGLIKMTIEQLQEYADLAAMLGGAPTAPSSKKLTSQALEAQGRILKVLERDLTRLHKKDHSLYKNLKIDRKLLDSYFAKKTLLTTQEWDLVKETRQKIDAYKQNLRKTLPKEPDEKLVEQERKKHINKRFNIRDEWLPLK